MRVHSDGPEAHRGVHLFRRIRGVSDDNDRAGPVVPAFPHAMVDERRRQASMAKLRMREEILNLPDSVNAGPGVEVGEGTAL